MIIVSSFCYWICLSDSLQDGPEGDEEDSRHLEREAADRHLLGHITQPVMLMIKLALKLADGLLTHRGFSAERAFYSLYSHAQLVRAPLRHLGKSTFIAWIE
jgi:hypothetical protein